MGRAPEGIARLPVNGSAPPGQNDDLHVWYCLTDSLDPDSIRAARSLLSDEERDRSDRFKFPVDRRDFIVAHALTRRALSAHGGLPADAWTFDIDGHGKPEVARTHAEWTPLRFNLSHTRGLVGCAVTRDADVGLDVESIGAAPRAESFARRYFAPDEIDFLERCPTTDRAERLINLWTLKEAYIKALGEGLSHPLDSCSFTFADGGELHFTSASASHRIWHFALFAPGGQYRMAVAVAGASTTIACTCRDDGRAAAPRLLWRTSRFLLSFARS